MKIDSANNIRQRTGDRPIKKVVKVEYFTTDNTFLILATEVNDSEMHNQSDT